ncbi:post-transcriptional regulator [Halobacillus sp. A5]|uniref:post-transcriptional regulator n=1 Tax=Halobacillus sp. A5 TaxID=2880263 RepID=UPI0020A647D6|nr:post-transcriptional regulator [Halobacillus sp. A5]MCP3025567.1 post-transcriptional regulator [Halobacillus sp. A5]
MEEAKPVTQWKDRIMPVLNSKAHEFRMLGYKKASTEDVWQCMQKKIWKNNPDKRLYEVVQDIFHLSNNQYVSFITVEAYQNDDLMASIEALKQGSESSD